MNPGKHGKSIWKQVPDQDDVGRSRVPDPKDEGRVVLDPDVEGRSRVPDHDGKTEDSEVDLERWSA